MDYVLVDFRLSCLGLAMLSVAHIFLVMSLPDSRGLGGIVCWGAVYKFHFSRRQLADFYVCVAFYSHYEILSWLDLTLGALYWYISVFLSSFTNSRRIIFIIYIIYIIDDMS